MPSMCTFLCQQICGRAESSSDIQWRYLGGSLCQACVHFCVNRGGRADAGAGGGAAGSDAGPVELHHHHARGLGSHRVLSELPSCCCYQTSRQVVSGEVPVGTETPGGGDWETVPKAALSPPE